MNKQQSDITIFKRLIQQAKPYWGYIVFIFLLSLLAAPLALLVPVPLKIIVDSVIGDLPLPGVLDSFIPDTFISSKYILLLFAVILQVSVVLLIQLQSLITYVMQTYVGERLTLNFRKRLFSHIQRLSFAFHDKRGTADSIYRIQYDTPSIQNIVLYGIIPLLSSFLTLIGMVYVILRINVQLALVAFTVMPLAAIFTRYYSVRMRPYYKRLKQKQSQVLGIVQEVLTAFRVVKAFGREEAEEERFEAAFRRSSKTAHPAVFCGRCIWPVDESADSHRHGSCALYRHSKRPRRNFDAGRNADGHHLSFTDVRPT